MPQRANNAQSIPVTLKSENTNSFCALSEVTESYTQMIPVYSQRKFPKCMLLHTWPAQTLILLFLIVLQAKPVIPPSITVNATPVSMEDPVKVEWKDITAIVHSVGRNTGCFGQRLFKDICN